MLELNKDNYLDYAKDSYMGLRIKNSDNFSTLLKYFPRIRKLLADDTRTPTKNRMLLNNIVILYNSFGMKPTTRLLFYFMPDEYQPDLKTLLIYLGCLPASIAEADLDNILINNILYNKLEDL
jgi:hypothetical protein